MSIYDSSDQLSDSLADDQTEGDGEEVEEERVEGKEEDESGSRDSEGGTAAAHISFSDFSSSLRAVMRIRQKYLAMKKRRLEMPLFGGGPRHVTGAPVRSSPKIFTFDPLMPSAAMSAAPERKRKRRKGVLYPTGRVRRAPPKQAWSRAKYCLYLLCNGNWITHCFWCEPGASILSNSTPHPPLPYLINYT